MQRCDNSPTTPVPSRLPRRDATHSPPAALASLFDALDAYAGPVPLEHLVSLLQACPVTAADLGDAIAVDGAAYVRTLVFERRHVEVLVMAWLPGQRSPIHDHAGSACGVRIVAGEALERLYECDGEGMARYAGERRLAAGSVTGAFDEEMHSLGNAASAPAPPSHILVTIHAYSPPLQPTRKYVERTTEGAPQSGPGASTTSGTKA